jgi:hypothetical protein
METTLRKQIETLINMNLCEAKSQTPDFILAGFLEDCLIAFDKAVNRRIKWYKS